MRVPTLASFILLAASCFAQNNQISLGLTSFGFGSFVDFPVAVADVNGDGKLDIIAYDIGSASLAVLLGKGDGTFDAPLRTKVNAVIGGFTLAFADFNHDGKLDVVGAGGGLVLLLGNGDGTFQSGQILTTSVQAASVASFDLNRDGNADLVIGGVGQVAILLGNGDGTFQTEQDYAQGNDLDNSLVVTDFNGDSILDIATTGQNDALSVLLGNGDGTFQPAVQIPLTVYPEFVLAADLNRDGYQDLIAQSGASSPVQSTISVLLGNGDGTFKTEVDYPAPGSSTGFAVGQFNSSGIIDLVTASSHAGLVMILQGKGDGTFGVPTFAAADGAPSGLAVGDLDGDGLDDVATLAPRRTRVSILRHGQSVLSRTLINFGHVPIGRVRTTPLTITNAGSAAFTISSTKITGPYSQNFMRTSICDGVTLNAGASCTLKVTLAPTTKYQMGGVLVITSNGTPGTQSVSLYGTTD